MGVKTEYKDGLFGKVFMGLLACKMEKFTPSGGKLNDDKNLLDWDYESFVDVSKRVMVGRSRSQQNRKLSGRSFSPCFLLMPPAPVN